MTAFTVEELVVPTTVNDSDAADFVANIEIINAVQAEACGHNDLDLAPVEMLPSWRNPASPRTLFGVHVDGQLVGRSMYARLLADPSTCWVSVGVLPAFRGRGIGSALLAALEAVARTQGSTRIFVEASELARPLFERRGYAFIRRNDFEVNGVPIHNFKMEKSLRLA